jgi:hypothetical protein
MVARAVTVHLAPAAPVASVTPARPGPLASLIRPAAPLAAAAEAREEAAMARVVIWLAWAVRVARRRPLRTEFRAHEAAVAAADSTEREVRAVLEGQQLTPILLLPATLPPSLVTAEVEAAAAAAVSAQAAQAVQAVQAEQAVGQA